MSDSLLDEVDKRPKRLPKDVVFRSDSLIGG